ncbi:MAG TPA: hypothetical protein VMN60_13220 [Longimicrobiales bacterium]|nr:hypothetical protein [Longimicrobiales bacterium]
MLLITVFAALVLIRYLAILALAALIIRPVRACPACFADTFPVRQRWLRPLAGQYEWRWCPTCGWQAIARRTPLRAQIR